jgi:glycosyltransferase involved in cell wall biosynthesis
MKSKPLVTIVTPSYNQGRFVEETIRSVLNQTYKNIEYIFVDGGSTDNTMQIVNKYIDKINIVIHEKDNGQADAINKGVKIAKGELVGWINSDDLIYPDCVEKIVQLYQNKPDGAVYYSSYLDWIDEQGEIINTRNVNIPNRGYLLNKNYVIIQQGSFYPKDIVQRINYLDVNNHYCMDLALWLDLLEVGKIYSVQINTPLAAFRMYSGTKTDTGKIKFLLNIKEVLLSKGAKWYSKNILVRIYIYMIKIKIKSVLCHQ